MKFWFPTTQLNFYFFRWHAPVFSLFTVEPVYSQQFFSTVPSSYRFFSQTVLFRKIGATLPRKPPCPVGFSAQVLFSFPPVSPSTWFTNRLRGFLALFWAWRPISPKARPNLPHGHPLLFWWASFFSPQSFWEISFFFFFFEGVFVAFFGALPQPWYSFCTLPDSHLQRGLFSVISHYQLYCLHRPVFISLPRLHLSLNVALTHKVRGLFSLGDRVFFFFALPFFFPVLAPSVTRGTTSLIDVCSSLFCSLFFLSFFF